MAYAFEYQPDLILELGRGYGNSTCAFTEAANHLLPHSCTVLSICHSTEWRKKTHPRLKNAVLEDWFKPLRIVEDDILAVDYETYLAGYKRVLVFWDAHGVDVAECVLGKILPLLQNTPHVVIMHDVYDSRYGFPDAKKYAGQGLWRGGNYEAGRVLCINNLQGCVDQIVSIADFSSRNDLTLHSADESLHAEIGKNERRGQELVRLLGDGLFSLRAYWFYFSLYGEQKELTFPTVGTRDGRQPIHSKRLKWTGDMLMGLISRGRQ